MYASPIFTLLLAFFWSPLRKLSGSLAAKLSFFQQLVSNFVCRLFSRQRAVGLSENSKQAAAAGNEVEQMTELNPSQKNMELIDRIELLVLVRRQNKAGY